MARGRMIAKTLSTSQRFARLNEVGGRLAEFCQCLYPLLVAHADDFGRLQGDVFTVKLTIHPTSPRKEPDFAAALSHLHNVSLITWYEVDNRKYVQINEFEKYQAGLHKRTRSGFPDPPPDSRNVVEIPLEEKRTEEKRTEPRERAGTPQPHPIRDLIGDYQQRFEATTGTKPSINGKRDASIFSTLLKDHDPDAIRAALEAFFVDAYAINAGFPLPLFRSQFSSYAAKAVRAVLVRAGPTSGMYAVPDVETTRRKYLTDRPDEREPTERRTG